MADVLSDVAIDLIAEFILGQQGVLLQLSVGLFVNDVQVTSQTVFSDLVECTAPGYARFVLNPALWQGGVQAGVASFSYPALTFQITGPGNPAQTVYGHFVYDATSKNILWAANWNPPWAIPFPVTQNPTLSPAWQDQQCS